MASQDMHATEVAAPNSAIPRPLPSTQASSDDSVIHWARSVLEDKSKTPEARIQEVLAVITPLTIASPTPATKPNSSPRQATVRSSGIPPTTRLASAQQTNVTPSTIPHGTSAMITHSGTTPIRVEDSMFSRSPPRTISDEEERDFYEHLGLRKRTRVHNQP